MFKLFWNMGRVCQERLADAGEDVRASNVCLDWARDPLSHPVLEVMDPTQLADLPARELRSRRRD